MIRLCAAMLGFGRFVSICFLIALLVSAYVRISTECYSRIGGSIAASAVLNSSSVNVHFIDVGWGDAIFIDTLGIDVLVDGGLVQAGPTVLEYLGDLGIARVDLMVVTHPHSDHYGGLMTILNSSLEVNQVLFNNESHPYDFLQLARSHNLTVAYRGQTFALADDVALKALNPVQPPQFPPADWSRHYNNIVLKLQVGNTSFLFTGDANALVEQSMIDAGLDLRSDVLKVGIHGCGEITWENVTSQGFLDKVHPSCAVISCDYSNGAGAIVPDPLVARRLIASNITISTTYLAGTIVAYTDGTSITFSNNARCRYIAELRGHAGAVYSLGWSPDETLLASGSKDGTVRLWDTGTWNVARTINAHTFGVWSVAWSPDGTRLATGGVENAVRLWNPQTGEQTAIFNTSSSVLSVSWSPDGGRLAAGLSNGNVYVFNVETGETLLVLIGHTNVVVSTAWAPDGSRLASGSIDGSVRIWDSRNGSTLFTLYANTTARNDINGLAWSPAGTILAAAGQDGNVRLWNPDSGLEIQVATHDRQGWSRGVSWSIDGLFLATTGQDYFVRFLCPKISRDSVTLPGHLSPVWSVAWSPSGKLFATGSGMYETVGGDTRVLVWNVSAIQDGIVVVPDDYATIQEAINSASDGDSIFVAAGTYHEHVVVNKAVSLVGEDAETTVIDGNNTGHVVNVVSGNVSITGFTVRNGGSSGWPALDSGICLNLTTGCNVSGNVVINNGFAGVSLLDSPRNLITGNNVSLSGWSGVHLMNSSGNTVSGNILDSNVLGGINGHVGSNYNNITDNVIVNSTYGMFYHASAYNNICRNNISRIAFEAIWLQDQVSHNVVAENKLTNAEVAVWLEGPNTNNTLVANAVTDCVVGFNLTQSSAGNSVQNNSVTHCHVGVQTTSSNQNSIFGNHVSENNCSLRLSSSHFNRVFENEIGDSPCGIALQYCSDNRFYHNNFINNTLQVSILSSGSSNIWDNGYPSGGNYWSDYNGTDEDWDGIGNTPYTIDQSNRDNYPLMYPFPARPPFPWDLNGDGYVGIDDILEAAQSFGTTPESPRWNSKADINNDSYVGIDDILQIAMNFGKSAPQIPEYTASATLLSFVAPNLILFPRKRADEEFLLHEMIRNKSRMKERTS